MDRSYELALLKYPPKIKDGVDTQEMKRKKYAEDVRLIRKITILEALHVLCDECNNKSCSKYKCSRFSRIQELSGTVFCKTKDHPE